MVLWCLILKTKHIYIQGDYFMFDVYKKRIIYVIMTLSVCLIYTAVTNLWDLKKETIIDVNSTPITNKTIILDAGHGLPDSGAVRILCNK